MNTYPLKWITKSLAVGYAPRSDDDLSFLRAVGIRATVNLCAECYDLHKVENDYGFEVYYLPIADEATPLIEELKTLMDWLKNLSDAGDPTLVHCRYGIGRTGKSFFNRLRKALRWHE